MRSIDNPISLLNGVLCRPRLWASGGQTLPYRIMEGWPFHNRRAALVNLRTPNKTRKAFRLCIITAQAVMRVAVRPCVRFEKWRSPLTQACCGKTVQIMFSF